MLKKVENILSRPALFITEVVGTATCALVFAVIAIVALPSALESGSPVIMVAWLSSNFLQLVLLSILAVGQKVQGASTEALVTDTHAIATESRDQTKEILKEILALTQELKKAIDEKPKRSTDYF